jgi:site-specific DNA-cytosine methylase
LSRFKPTFTFKAESYAGVDVVVGGLPCLGFSVAGKRLGIEDERSLFSVWLFCEINNLKGADGCGKYA